jgi:hypothetical protein
MDPPSNHESISLSSDSCTHVIQLLHQLQSMCGATREDPITVLTACVERIELLQAQCTVLERRLQDSTLSCSEAEIRAQQSEIQYEHCQKVIQSLMTVALPTHPASRASPSTSADSTSRSHTPSYTPEQRQLTPEQHYRGHIRPPPVDIPSHQSMSPLMHTHFARQSSDTTSMSESTQSRSELIAAVVDQAANVIQCSSSFAELFSFNYFRSRSSPGVYNLFTLAPLGVDSIARLLEQTRSHHVFDSRPLTCIIAVEGWSKISTVVMSLRAAMPNEVSGARSHEGMLWATFEVVGTTQPDVHPSGRATPSRSFP